MTYHETFVLSLSVSLDKYTKRNVLYLCVYIKSILTRAFIFVNQKKKSKINQNKKDRQRQKKTKQNPISLTVSYNPVIWWARAWVSWCHHLSACQCLMWDMYEWTPKKELFKSTPESVMMNNVSARTKSWCVRICCVTDSYMDKYPEDEKMWYEIKQEKKYNSVLILNTIGHLK